MDAAPSPDSTVSDDDGHRRRQVRSPSPGTPATEQEDGGGEKKQPTRAEAGRIAMDPSPSPDSTVSSHDDDDGRHRVLSPPLGPPAPEPEDGGSNSLMRAVLSLSLSEPGITTVKAGSSAPRAADPTSSPPGSAVSSDYQEPDDGAGGTGENKPTHARFLVSHAEAGLIIGTGGSAVAAVEARSGARIKLSRHDQLLSGTDRRVVLVSGTFSQVMDAMELLLEKLLNQGDQAIDSQYTTVVLVVPQACCGQLIGKGGSVIRSLTEVSEAEIQVSPQDTCYGSNDRLVSITGPVDNQLQALFLILFMLLENVNYTLTYAAAMPDTSVGSPDDNCSDVQGTLTIGVADEYVGAVIGRAGRTIKEIEQVSGAWIVISAKGEFIPGTHDREVIITGTSEAIRAAEAMIMRRVSVASGKGDEFTWQRVEGRSGKGGEITPRLDEQADDAVLQMHRLQLSDGSKARTRPNLPNRRADTAGHGDTLRHGRTRVSRRISCNTN